jgi:hypothetical protein
MSRPFRFGVITSGAPDGRTWRERAFAPVVERLAGR